MLTTYLNTLKNQGNFTFDDISNLSGISKDTVKNVFSGKTEAPRIETVAPIIYAMGGSLDSIYNPDKKESSDTISIVMLKEMHERHLSDIKHHYEHRLLEIKERHEERIAEINEHIDTIKLDKKWFRIATCVLAVAFVALLIAEVMNPDLGWIRY